MQHDTKEIPITLTDGARQELVRLVEGGEKRLPRVYMAGFG